MSRFITTVVVVAGICLCTAQLVPSAEPSAANEKSNLLLITLDTVRADHLSCNGSKTVHTPHIDRPSPCEVDAAPGQTVEVPVSLEIAPISEVVTVDASSAISKREPHVDRGGHIRRGLHQIPRKSVSKRALLPIPFHVKLGGERAC